MLRRTDLTLFENCFDIVIGTEGGLSLRPEDPGNWTGKACGVGACKGTKYGISAASYPETEIASLTLMQAQALYIRDYWRPLCGDDLPAPLALQAFDAAINNGLAQAARWLQMIAEAPVDGVVGPVTLGRLHAVIAIQGIDAVCAEYLALRLWMMSQMVTWKIFGRGWSRRLCRLPFQGRAMVIT